MFVYHVSESLDELFDGVRGSVVGDADSGFDAAVAAAAHVFDVGGDEFGVGHHDEGVLEGADASGSDGDLFDSAFDIVDDDPIADLEGHLEEDSKGAEDVFNAIFSGEGNDQTADAEAGDKVGDVYTDFAEENDECADDNERAGEVS